MKISHIILFIVASIITCKGEKPCSPLDSSCNLLGYILPDLISNSNRKIKFNGLNYLTILSSTSVRLGWTAATSTVGSPIEYNIYSANTSGGQNFSTPLQTVAGVTTATITGITAGTNNYYVVRAKDIAGNVDTNTNERAALFNGLIRFIPLDSGSLTTGEKIGGGAVTAIGSPSTTSTDRKGTVNNAYTLNGSTQHFTFSETTPVALPTGSASKTFCAWTRTTNLNSQTIIGYGGNTTGHANFLMIHDIGYTYLAYDQSGSFANNSDASSTFTNGNWNFVCVTILRTATANICGFQLNDSYLGENVNVTTALNSINNTTGKIGAFSNTLSQRFNGSIAEVSIWNRILTQAEMLAVSKN
ncbi:MAG: LamG-like jellyroll fold domain-containing protein [Leptospiraceae bacterium]|nr:LamG-like jellyroll fold domain-containing protein [Leptospiraceae bacterium]